MGQGEKFSRALRKLVSLPRLGKNVVLIGGFAVSFHGFVRFTNDLDVFLFVGEADAQTVYDLLSKVGELSDFRPDAGFARVEVEEVKVDMMLTPASETRDSVLIGNVFKRAAKKKLPGIQLKVKMAAPEEIISLKVLASRPKDIGDIDWLLKHATLDWDVLAAELREVFSWKPSIRKTVEKFWPEVLEKLEESGEEESQVLEDLDV